MLDVPLTGDEFGGQPVKQFRVHWQLALGTELFACTDDADSKDCFPVSVGNDASGQRIPLVDQPLRQSEPVWRQIIGQRVEGCGNSFGHFVARLLKIPSDLNLRDSAFISRQVFHDRNRCRWLERRQLLLQSCKLAAFFGKFGSNILHEVRCQRLLLSGRTLILRRSDDGQLVVGDPGKFLNSTVAACGDSEMRQRVIFVFRNLLDRYGKRRLIFDGDHLLWNQCQLVISVCLSADCPTL